MAKPLWIDGQWFESSSGTLIAIENPATGEKIADAVEATSADVDRAV